MTKRDLVLDIQNLSVEFKTDRGLIRAVDNLSLKLFRGDTLGVVGESGCGKSVSALAILGLIQQPNGRIAEGKIILEGKELTTLREIEYRRLRGRDISMIFQDPMTALNPVFTVGRQMNQILRRHQRLNYREAKRLACNMLERVGINSVTQRYSQFPHELSGGMRQRVMIAMALLCKPKLLIADEPTTALDVTTQAQVLEEIKILQRDMGMTMILITHDMGVIAEIAEQVLVMYCGKAVETGSATAIFTKPCHPYTHGLLTSIPTIRSVKLQHLPVIPGSVPDLLNLPNGCRFADRCHRVLEQCRSKDVVMKVVNERGFACLNPYESEG